MYYYYYMLLYVNVFWARKIEIPFSTSHPLLVEYRCKYILKTLKFNTTLQKNSPISPSPSNSTLSNQNCYGINNLQTRKTAFKFRDNGIYKSLIHKVIFSLQFLLTEFYNKYQSATKQVSQNSPRFSQPLWLAQIRDEMGPSDECEQS